MISYIEFYTQPNYESRVKLNIKPSCMQRSQNLFPVLSLYCILDGRWVPSKLERKPRKMKMQIQKTDHIQEWGEGNFRMRVKGRLRKTAHGQSRDQSGQELYQERLQAKESWYLFDLFDNMERSFRFLSENLRLPFLGTYGSQTNKWSDYEPQSKQKSYKEGHVIWQYLKTLWIENVVYRHYNV